MTGRDIGSVLNFAAFRPEPDDSTAPWKKRFPSQRTVVVSIGRAGLQWKAFDKKGKPGDEGTVPGELKDAIATISMRLKDSSDAGWCAVSMNTRYVITLESNLSRRQGSEEAIRENPRSVLGARYERGKRYAVTHNPETNSSIIVSCDEEHIKRTETLLKESGLHVGRVCCGAYVLLRHTLTQTNNSRAGGNPSSSFYITCAMGSVCALVQDQDRWIELRSRPDVYDPENLQPIVDLISPFRQRLAPEVDIVIACDQILPGLKDQLSTLFSGHKITDLSQPDLLWTLIAQG